MEYKCASVEQTIKLGEAIGRLVPAGQVIALDGPLGTGKTQLVRGIALGAGVADISLVCSPTYVLLNIYPADETVPRAKTVYHLDAYRVRSTEDFAAIGFDELLDQDGIVVLEWASRTPGLLGDNALHITGTVLDETSRLWRLAAQGEESEKLLKELAAKMMRGEPSR